jgi:hypothetical protein
MTIIEKDQKIAEAVGLKNVRWIKFGAAQILVHGDEIGTTGCFASVPQYFKSLEAMHEAEKSLNYQQRRDYCKTLFALPPNECESNTFATAAQRAEAFGRALNLWESSK